MTDKPLKIISFKKISPLEKDGGSYYEIIFSDGSEWVCDENGRNWKLGPHRKEAVEEKFRPKNDVAFSNDELMEKFINRKNAVR